MDGLRNATAQVHRQYLIQLLSRATIKKCQSHTRLLSSLQMHYRQRFAALLDHRTRKLQSSERSTRRKVRNICPGGCHADKNWHLCVSAFVRRSKEDRNLD